MLAILRADTPELVDAARVLFTEYGAMPHALGRWPGREEEIAGLPEPYEPPGGVLLVATEEDVPIACVAVRALAPPESCEMKRLYVRPGTRGRGVGRALVYATLDFARDAGYAVMRLDTAPELHAAIALYRSLGFRSVEPYHDRYGDVVFFELELEPAPPGGASGPAQPPAPAERR